MGQCEYLRGQKQDALVYPGPFLPYVKMICFRSRSEDKYRHDEEERTSFPTTGKHDYMRPSSTQFT